MKTFLSFSLQKTIRGSRIKMQQIKRKAVSGKLPDEKEEFQLYTITGRIIST